MKRSAPATPTTAPNSAKRLAPTPSAPAPSPAPAPRLWLDILPFDLSVRLATYLTQDEPPYQTRHTPSALALAHVSPRQRHAVLDALSYSLDFPISHSARWLALFRPVIRHLHCPDITYACFNRPAAAAIFDAPTLTTVSISNRRVFLHAVARAVAVRSLSLQFWDDDTPHLLTRTLAALPALVALHLECADRIPGETPCVFKRVFRMAKVRNGIAAACPNLEELSLICNCARSVCRRSLGPILDMWPNLRRLTTNKHVPDACIHRLQQFECVVLQQPGGVPMKQQLDVATMIGPVMKGLVHRRPACDNLAGVEYRGMLAGLKGCCNLTSLHLVLARGAEGGIPVLANLTSLRLRWFGERQNANVSWAPESAAARHMYVVLEHYRLPMGFVRRMLGWTPHLRELCLFQAEISFGEIEFALQKTGTSLEVFGTTFTQQLEPPLERVLLILETVTKYNGGLKRLELEGAEGMTRMGICDERKKEGALVPVILRATRRLRMFAPYLDVDGMLGSIIPWMS